MEDASLRTPSSQITAGLSGRPALIHIPPKAPDQQKDRTADFYQPLSTNSALIKQRRWETESQNGRGWKGPLWVI